MNILQNKLDFGVQLTLYQWRSQHGIKQTAAINIQYR